ncbi:MAG: hypothetical protein PVF14_14705 [Desulfobacterales bacterium]|jgi:hypothetical protein
MKKITSLLSTQSLIYFLICAVGIIVFVFLIIIPAQRTSAELDASIEDLGRRIDEQRILKPVFENLLKRVKSKNQTGLPITKKAKLARGDIGNLSTTLQEMAQRYDLNLKEIKTDVTPGTNKNGYLLMQIDVTGDFIKFRDFLIDLGTIPSLEHIETVDIRAIEANREIKLKIWLAQK